MQLTMYVLGGLGLYFLYGGKSEPCKKVAKKWRKSGEKGSDLEVIIKTSIRVGLRLGLGQSFECFVGLKVK